MIGNTMVQYLLSQKCQKYTKMVLANILNLPELSNVLPLCIKTTPNRKCIGRSIYIYIYIYIYTYSYCLDPYARMLTGTYCHLPHDEKRAKLDLRQHLGQAPVQDYAQLLPYSSKGSWSPREKILARIFGGARIPNYRKQMDPLCASALVGAHRQRSSRYARVVVKQVQAPRPIGGGDTSPQRFLYTPCGYGIAFLLCLTLPAGQGLRLSPKGPSTKYKNDSGFLHTELLTWLGPSTSYPRSWTLWHHSGTFGMQRA